MTDTSKREELIARASGRVRAHAEFSRRMGGQGLRLTKLYEEHAELATALESTLAELRQERERAESLERNRSAWIADAHELANTAQAALSRAEETIEKVREESEHAMHPEQLPTRCGVCRIERLLTEYDKQKEVEHD